MRIHARAFAWLLFAAACGEGDDNSFPPLSEPTYPSVAEVEESLAGLSFGEFLEVSFAAILGRSPETLTDIGLSASHGLRDNFLDDASDPFLTGNYDLADAVLAALRRYDRTALGPADRLSYDVYAWYLDDVARERPFMHHAYSINPGITSQHRAILSLLTQVHPLATQANAEDYVERMWRVRRRVDQVIAGLEAREREGLVPPKAVLGPALNDIAAFAGEQPGTTVLYARLADGLAGVPGLSAGARRRLLDEGARAIRVSVLPAWRDLADAVRRMYPSAPDGEGAWVLPDGDAYYTYALRHHTTNDVTPDEIHNLGIDEVQRLQLLIRDRFTALGYQDGISLTSGFAQVAAASGQMAAADCLARYTAIIRAAEAHLGPAIDVQPRVGVEVRGDPVGGYYVAGSPDGSRPGVFYAAVPAGGLPAYSMKTLAYHEAVPGHHLQIGLARERDDVPALRRALVFTAHAEGWALYAELVAAELGFYDGDVYGDLGRLQYELFRAVRLVVDTGLHARRWTSGAAAAYLRDNLGFPSEVLRVPGQVTRYLSWPGQATAYKVGMQRILAARTDLQTRLGAAYDPRTFHRVLLEAGSVPLPVLEGLVAEMQ